MPPKRITAAPTPAELSARSARLSCPNLLSNIENALRKITCCRNDADDLYVSTIEYFMMVGNVGNFDGQIVDLCKTHVRFLVKDANEQARLWNSSYRDPENEKKPERRRELTAIPSSCLSAIELTAIADERYSALDQLVSDELDNTNIKKLEEIKLTLTVCDQRNLKAFAESKNAVEAAKKLGIHPALIGRSINKAQAAWAKKTADVSGGAL